ncbi:nuclear transport factor 2 family protein, partial [Streptomyces tendae]|uniref:nuclear transport factor 2 family protein n=1 Tax=Streptomyces tendae TaxID=1932 RepID=UPI00364DACFF
PPRAPRAPPPWGPRPPPRGTGPGTPGAAAAAHYRELAEHQVPEQAATEVERILVDGTDAVVLGEIRQTARPTGRAYRARFALHLTVENGLITRHHVYEDSLTVAQAFEQARG